MLRKRKLLSALLGVIAIAIAGVLLWSYFERKSRPVPVIAFGVQDSRMSYEVEKAKYNFLFKAPIDTMRKSTLYACDESGRRSWFVRRMFLAFRSGAGPEIPGGYVSDAAFIADSRIPFYEYKDGEGHQGMLDLRTNKLYSNEVSWNILSFQGRTKSGKLFALSYRNALKGLRLVEFNRETSSWDDAGKPNLREIIEKHDSHCQYLSIGDNIVFFGQNTQYNCFYSNIAIFSYEADRFSSCFKLTCRMGANKPQVEIVKVNVDDVFCDSPANMAMSHGAAQSSQAGFLPVIEDLSSYPFSDNLLIRYKMLTMDRANSNAKSIDEKSILFDPSTGKVNEIAIEYVLPGGSRPHDTNQAANYIFSQPVPNIAYRVLCFDSDFYALFGLSRDNKAQFIDYCQCFWMNDPKVTSGGILWYVRFLNGRDPRDVDSLNPEASDTYPTELVRYDPVTGEKRVVFKGGRITELYASID